MKKEQLDSSRFEYTGYSESRISQQIDQIKNRNIKGSILFSQKSFKRKRSFKWSRIRSFFIMHKEFKRLMEFSCHPSGIHLLRLAVFHSENGCGMCRVYIEKNLF